MLGQIASERVSNSPWLSRYMSKRAAFALGVVAEWMIHAVFWFGLLELVRRAYSGQDALMCAAEPTASAEQARPTRGERFLQAISGCEWPSPSSDRFLRASEWLSLSSDREWLPPSGGQDCSVAQVEPTPLEPSPSSPPFFATVWGALKAHVARLTTSPR